MLWPIRINFRRKNDLPSTDWRGRRYGEHIWFSISFGHLHFNILPVQVRGVWASIYLRERFGRG